MFKNKILEELVGFQGRVGVTIEVEGESFYFQSEEVFPSASVIKIPILIEVLRQSELGKINVNQMVSNSSKTGGSGVLQALSPVAKITIKDLMTLMIIVSDNTATNRLIDLVGMEAVNASMKNMGLQETVLNRKMMDFEAKELGLDNFTSPRDMITCLKVINEGGYLSEASREAAVEIMHYQQFQDKLLGMIDGDRIFTANKTGSLPHVENDCAVFKYNGKTAYVAVLMDKLDDVFAGRLVISKIGKHVYDYLLEGK
jgi:beta-lactamase class A